MLLGLLLRMLLLRSSTRKRRCAECHTTETPRWRYNGTLATRVSKLEGGKGHVRPFFSPRRALPSLLRRMSRRSGRAFGRSDERVPSCPTLVAVCGGNAPLDRVAHVARSARGVTG